MGLRTNACDDATRLLAAYRAALAEYDKVRAFQTLAPEHITWQEAAQARDDAHAILSRARRVYWRHVEVHACRRLILTTPTKGVSGTISLHLG